MSETKRDDTPETPVGARPESARRSGRSYYYDDATGYEIYDPQADAEDECDSEDEADDRSVAPQTNEA